LIPQFQHVAAAGVTAGTELFILGFLLMSIPRDLFSRDVLVFSLRATAAVAIMVLVLVSLSGPGLALLVSVGGVSYVASALRFRLVSTDDLLLFKRALLKRGDRRLVGAEASN